MRIAILLAATWALQLPTFQATRDLRIGAVDDPALAMSWVAGLEVGMDGRMYVLDYQDNSVRIFDPAGRLLRKIGRKGNGPGETTNPAGIGWVGDTLWIFDSVQRRFNMFSPDGEFYTTVTVIPAAAATSAVYAYPNSMFADGTVLANLRDGGPLNDENRPSILVRTDRKGSILDTVAIYSVKNRTLQLADPEHPRKARRFTAQPFSDAALTIVGGDRTGFYLIDRPAATNARQGTFTIRKVGPDGRALLNKRFTYVPQRLIRTQVDSFVQSQIESATKGDQPLLRPATAQRIIREALFVPEYHPPITAAVLGRDGTIWLRREDLGRAVIQWMVLDRSGNPLGMVDLPRAFRPIAADRSTVWGEERDEFDVPYIARYRILQRA